MGRRGLSQVLDNEVGFFFKKKIFGWNGEMDFVRSVLIWMGCDKALSGLRGRLECQDRPFHSRE